MRICRVARGQQAVGARKLQRLTGSEEKLAGLNTIFDSIKGKAEYLKLPIYL